MPNNYDKIHYLKLMARYVLLKLHKIKFKPNGYIYYGQLANQTTSQKSLPPSFRKVLNGINS